MTNLEKLQEYLDNSNMMHFHATLKDLSGITFNQGQKLVYDKRQEDVVHPWHSLAYKKEVLPEDIALEILESFNKKMEDIPDKEVLGKYSL